MGAHFSMELCEIVMVGDSPCLQGTDRVDLCDAHNGSKGLESGAAAFPHLHATGQNHNYTKHVGQSAAPVNIHPALSSSAFVLKWSDSPLHNHTRQLVCLRTLYLWSSSAWQRQAQRHTLLCRNPSHQEKSSRRYVCKQWRPLIQD